MPGVTTIGYEVLGAMLIKSSAFWEVAASSLLKINQHFQRTCCFHLQGQTESQASNVIFLQPFIMVVSCLSWSSSPED
jgi:hypothetical protein